MKYRIVVSIREYHEFRVDADSLEEAYEIAEERAASDYLGAEVEDVFEEE